MTNTISEFNAVASEPESSFGKLKNLRENAELMGLASGAIGDSINPRGAVTTRKYKDLVEQEKRRQMDAAQIDYWQNLLGQLKDHEHNLTNSINDRLNRLQEKYGSDPITGIAETHLDTDELKGANTPEEKMQRLINKYLDKDGKPKPGTDLDPEVLALLQDWRERQLVRDKIPEFERRYREEGMTPELGKDIEDLVKEATDDQTYASMQETANAGLKHEIKTADMTEADGVKDVVSDLNFS